MVNQMVMMKVQDLKSGQDIGIDSRSRSCEDGIEAFADNIEANGLLQPLGIWFDAKRAAFVVFGNRRLRALQLIEERTNHQQQAPCVVLEGALEEMLALSTIENTDRLPLHPVEQFEAFARMAELGMSTERIAERFGVETKEVRRRLRIGALHQDIRDAWARGELGADAAMAFGHSADQVEQLAVYQRLGKQAWTLNRSNITRELCGDMDVRGRELAFVGRDTYLENGGELQENLFGDIDHVMNPGLLATLVTKRMDAEVKAALKAGWGAAIPASDAGDERWRWARIFAEQQPLTDAQAERVAEIEGRRWPEEMTDEESDEYDRLDAERDAILASAQVYTPLQMKGACAVFSVAPDGGLVTTAYHRPQEAEKAKAAAAKAPKEPATPVDPIGVISLAREAQTEGLAAVFSADPTAAKIALCATLLFTRRVGSPLVILAEGARSEAAGLSVQADDLPEAVARCRALSPSQLDRLIAQLVGAAIDSRSPARVGWQGAGVTDEGVSAIADLLDPAKLTAAIRQRLDLRAYFDGARKETALDCIREVAGPTKAAEWAKRKKGEIAEVAATLCQGLDWLPAPVRPKGYRGPIKAAEPKPEAEEPAPPAEAPKASVAKKRGARKAAAEA